MGDGRDLSNTFWSLGNFMLASLIRSYLNDYLAQNIWLHHSAKCLHNKVKQNDLMNYNVLSYHYMAISFMYLSCESSDAGKQKVSLLLFLFISACLPLFLSFTRLYISISKCVGLRRAYLLSQRKRRKREENSAGKNITNRKVCLFT